MSSKLHSSLSIHISSTKSQNKSQIKMKLLIVFVFCIVAALAAPSTDDVSVLKDKIINEDSAGLNLSEFVYTMITSPLWTSISKNRTKT